EASAADSNRAGERPAEGQRAGLALPSLGLHRSARSHIGDFLIALGKSCWRTDCGAMKPQAPTPSPFTNWPDTLIDPARFREEQARLARVWTFLGFAHDVAQDGDWFRATIATRSVFVQRLGDELRGFENRCAHRSFPLRNADKGNGPIVCGFHNWRYDKNGEAVDIPLCGVFGASPGELAARLNPIEIDTCGSLI